MDSEENIQQREQQQNRHYFYLNQLQEMARDLPLKYQQRLPYDLLSSLASTLLDGQVFDIVTSLKEVQQLEEKNLSNLRIKLINEFKSQKQEMIRKHREVLQSNSSRPHHLPHIQKQCHKEIQEFEARCREEERRRDMKVILELDQKVMDQQSMLEKAGIPGFFVTNNPYEVRLQMHLLDNSPRTDSMSSMRSTVSIVSIASSNNQTVEWFILCII